MYSGIRRKRKTKKRKVLACLSASLIGMSLICALYTSIFNNDKPESEGGYVPEKLIDRIENMMTGTYMPVFAFMREKTGTQSSEGDLLRQMLISQIPVFKYSEEEEKRTVSSEDQETYDMLIREEGTDEGEKNVDGESLEYGEDALHIEDDLENAMKEENGLHNKKQDEKEKKEESGEEKVPGTEGVAQPISETSGAFAKAEKKSFEYDWSGLKEYDDIISAFYAVDKTTSITDKQLNLDNLLGRDMSMQGGAENPQILIYHTHSQEAFADSVKGEVSDTIVGAGEKLATLLRENYGFNVIHHTGEYDVENRDYAYSNSLPAIEQLLLENPTVEVVIDLHRDAVDEGRKLAVNIQGRPTAQFMLFNGLSRTRQNGDISYLENPYVNDNLAFSFQAQIVCNEYYPGIARRIYLKAYRYNMHLRAKSMLVELGAQTNTVEEIMNACDPLAHVIAKVLSGETGDAARAAAGVEKDMDN